jgi:hypothetical protein
MKGAQMKKSVQLAFIALCILAPAIVKAETGCLFCKERFGIKSVESLDAAQKENGVSAAKNDILFLDTLQLKMLDDTEFIIPLKVSGNLTATLEFASGTTAVVTPWGVSIIAGAGYQQHDDVQNTINFMETYASNNCILYVILCIALFYFYLALVFCYLALVTC